jgi:hypothetical protein
MRKIILQLSCVLLLTVPLAMAQVVGTLSGKILAGNGTPIPNAAVTVTNAVTGASVKVLSGPDGGFAVAGLPPGTYRVDVETQGYKRTSKPDIHLVAGPPEAITITLQAGSMYESVELRGTAPAIQSDGGQIAIALDTRLVRELPVIDRNHQQLVGLQTGVTPPVVLFDNVRDPDRNRFFSVNGQNPFTNLWLLDNVLNTEPFRDTAIRVIPEEAIQQTQIQTATLPAQRGFTSSGAINDITRPGTNDWHGSLFEFYSGNIIRTRGFFNTPNNPDPRFVYNQMGGTFGGHIIRDKAFVFGSYEGTYANGSNTTLSTVPTPAMVGGDFSAVPGLTLFNPNTGTATGALRTPFIGNVIPGGLINPTSAAIARFIPAPNQPGFVNNLVSNVPFQTHGNKADGRTDYNFNDHAAAFLRYGYTNFFSSNASPFGQVIGSGTRGRLIAQNAIGGLTYSFGPALVTDFRFGYNRYDQHINPLSNNSALAAVLAATPGLPAGTAPGSTATTPSLFNNLVGINIAGINAFGSNGLNTLGLPQFNVFGSAGYSPFTTPVNNAFGSPAFLPENPVDNTFNWVWAWGWHKSNHNVKWGVDIRRIRSDGFNEFAWNPFGTNGTAYFGPGATMSTTGPALSPFGESSNSFAAFLLGAPNQVGVTNYLATPAIRQTQYGLWLGDVIQFGRVTLDLGVRWEVYRPLETNNNGSAAFFNPATNTFSLAGVGGNSLHFWRTDLDAVAPRIGISYRATSKTVVRGGYSIHYFQPAYGFTGFMPTTFGTSSGVQGGFTTATTPFTATVSPGPAPVSAFANGAPADNIPAAVTPRFQETPYVQSYNFQVQQEFYYGTVLSAAYVGAVDRHLNFFEQLNSGLPGTGVLGLPLAPTGRVASTFLFDNGLNSNYNSLQASLNKRFAKGLSFMASYTYSKALGYTTASGYLINPFDRRANYGPLDFDRKHAFTFGHLWELPFGRNGKNWKATLLGGWQVNGIFTWDSGVPVTVTADPIGCNCPNSTVLANVTGPSFVPDDTSRTQVLNPAGFAAPAPGTFGNVGRNAVRIPGYRNYDLSLFKRFKVRDRANFELRGEAYNISNTPHFTSPITNVNAPDFGARVSTLNGSFGRQVNLALRILF